MSRQPRQATLGGFLVEQDEPEPTAAPEPRGLPGLTQSQPFSVGDLTGYLKALIEGDSRLESVWVQGEISNLVCAASGHSYFTLKDARATLKATLWAGNRRRIKTELKNGCNVIACGAVSLYEPRGEYQLIVSDLQAAGLGALYEAFERLKAALSAEGLFAPEKKLSLPFLPKGVGLVTSPTGAVVKDMYRVIRRRFPRMPIYLVPVRVQGEGAAAEIAAGLARLDRDPRVDVIIVARGGGSLEDLWAFNEEVTARAIAATSKPVISGVGHETDTTIADFVADRRAPTPSVAAELAVPVLEDLVLILRDRRGRLARGLKARLSFERERLGRAMACRFLRKPSLLVAERRLQLANRSRDLEFAFRERFQKERHRLAILTARLTGLNPQGVLERGYVLVRDESGMVISSASQASPAQPLIVRWHDGEARTRIESIHLEKPPLKDS